MVAYALFAVWWVRTQGLVTDRISATIAVLLFVAAANIGAPVRRWLRFGLDALIYAAMWFAYETTRGAADRIGAPLQITLGRTLDRIIFLGHDPTVWLQRRFYEPPHIRWYDWVASLIYYSHFIVPVVVIATLWATNRTEWVRFIRRFATMLAIACVTYIVLPTIPPWMAASEQYPYRVIPPLQRHTSRGLVDLGFHGFVHDWQHSLDWANPVAALPSLHAATAMFLALFFLPRIRQRWARIAVLAYPVTMAIALVYFAEHWVVDALAGFAVAWFSVRLWNDLERRATADRRTSRRRRASADR